eukprot:1149364-Pelagomonas_calceolata.AAC.4
MHLAPTNNADSSTQRDLLSQLYIHTAGIVAAQHRRAAALKAFESDLEMRLKGSSLLKDITLRLGQIVPSPLRLPSSTSVKAVTDSVGQTSPGSPIGHHPCFGLSSFSAALVVQGVTLLIVTLSRVFNRPPPMFWPDQLFLGLMCPASPPSHSISLQGLQQAATRVLGLHKSSGRAEKRMQQQVQELAGDEAEQKEVKANGLWVPKRCENDGRKRWKQMIAGGRHHTCGPPVQWQQGES